MQTLVVFPGAATPGMTMLGGDPATIRADGQRWRVAAMSTADRHTRIRFFQAYTEEPIPIEAVEWLLERARIEL